MTVTLGTVEFDVLDQPHAYLLHHLSGVVQQILDSGSGVDVDSLVGFLGDGVYDVLCVFLPDLRKRLPAHEFAGYPNRAAMDERVYDEEYARRTPTIPQIAHALEQCIEANGGEWFKKLIGLVDPQLARAAVTEMTATYLSKTSANSPLTSGESAPTSSGVADPRSNGMTEASPSLV